MEPPDEGYHGDTASQHGSEGTMTPDPHADLKQAIFQLPTEARRLLVQQLCQSLPSAVRLALLDDIGAMVFHDPVPKLPVELMLHIFSLLSPKDLLTSSAVSRPWRDRAQDQRLWRDCFTREGWVVDRTKMVDPEDLARRMGAQVAERIMRNKRIGLKKPHKRPRVEAFGENESTVAHVGGSEHEDREESTMDVDMDVDMDAKRDDTSLDDLNIKPSLFNTATEPKLSWTYLYKQRRRLESNWDNGKCKPFRLPQPEYEEEEGHGECVYTIQHHGNVLLSGSRDKTIKIWDLNTCRLKQTLKGHLASVLCLQFDPRPGEERDVIISGGSDNLVIVWRFSTGKILKKFQAHTESVLNLRFDDRYLITCSKDKTIKVWNRHALYPNDPLIPAHVVDTFVNTFPANEELGAYLLLDTLLGHQAAVNAVQINGDVIVSASGDRTIKSWDLQTGRHKKSYNGHQKGIACVQFDGRRIVSGSSDNTVRIFDFETQAEVACLDNHTNLVRTVQARFGDLDITTDEELLEQSREADRQFLDHLDKQPEPRAGPRRTRNAGSSAPHEMLSYGTKVPPGGGGSKWGRIVSGSYDESVIIWKKGKDGKWKPNQRLHQGAPARSVARANAPAAPIHPQQQNGPQQAQHAGQQVVNNPMPNNAGTANAQAGNAAAGQNPLAAIPNNLGQQVQALQGHNVPIPAPGGAAVVPPPAPAPVQQPGPHAHHHHHHHHNHQARIETNRVFKLQFDARRIVSCSQNKIVMGWDFANGDEDLEWIGDWSAETA